MSHLKGACEDISESTVLLAKYDRKMEFRLIWATPPACWSNVVLPYPYNMPPTVEKIPIG